MPSAVIGQPLPEAGKFLRYLSFGRLGFHFRRPTPVTGKEKLERTAVPASRQQVVVPQQGEVAAELQAACFQRLHLLQSGCGATQVHVAWPDHAPLHDDERLLPELQCPLLPPIPKREAVAGAVAKACMVGEGAGAVAGKATFLHEPWSAAAEIGR